MNRRTFLTLAAGAAVVPKELFAAPYMPIEADFKQYLAEAYDRKYLLGTWPPVFTEQLLQEAIAWLSYNWYEISWPATGYCRIKVPRFAFADVYHWVRDNAPVSVMWEITEMVFVGSDGETFSWTW